MRLSLVLKSLLLALKLALLKLFISRFYFLYLENLSSKERLITAFRQLQSYRLFSALLMFSMPCNNASGLKEILSMPSLTRNLANSGKSLGACPHNPILVLVFFADWIAMATIRLAAASFSSKRFPRIPVNT